MDVNSGNFEAMSERIAAARDRSGALRQVRVKRGLRDISGRGVLVGLTDIRMCTPTSSTGRLCPLRRAAVLPG